VAWRQLVLRIAALLCLAAGTCGISTSRAADTLLVGSVDATSANLWPLYIGQKLGYFEAADLKIELIFAQSNASVIQQLAAGSYNIAPSAGLVDPIRAIEKGAPVALVRILLQAPPYALLAKPAIKSMRDLKGKTIIIGGAKDITRIFTERMLAANGLKDGDYDYIFAGATSARFSALQSGAVDAAILTVPFNFYAESAGFTNLGFTFDYIPDMPFAGMAVNRNWAAGNGKLVERFLAAFNRGLAYFEDARNREDAVKLMVTTSKLKQQDVEKAYDFLHGKHLFEPTGKVSRVKLNQILGALKELGDVPAAFPVERLFLAGVTQVAD
jgi:ABC-type nitrate/sulfonate/bicarbonate transport system substrate-binding protein